jgi:hypothetical protein
LVFLVGYAALFGIKQFPIGTALTIPLIVIVVLYRQAIAANFDRPMKNLSLHAAADLDRADKVRAKLQADSLAIFRVILVYSGS